MTYDETRAWQTRVQRLSALTSELLQEMPSTPSLARAIRQVKSADEALACAAIEMAELANRTEVLCR